MIHETHDQRRIHVHDYREGYVKWCAVCGDGDEGHTTAAGYDHPFEEKPQKPIPCKGCGGFANPDFHFGVYITRVSYAVYCSRECAWKHDDSKWLEPA